MSEKLKGDPCLACGEPVSEDHRALCDACNARFEELAQEAIERAQSES